MNGQAGHGGDDLGPEEWAGTPFAALRSSRARAVLRERARRLAERPRSPAATAVTTSAPHGLIVVRCGSARYAFELSCLAGVHRAPPITSLPDAPAPCLGLAVIGGRVHAVFDLGLLLREPPATPAYLALVNLQDELIVAFAVAEIVGIQATRTLTAPPAYASAAVCGVTEDVTAVLDAAALVTIVGPTIAEGEDGTPSGEKAPR